MRKWIEGINRKKLFGKIRECVLVTTTNMAAYLVLCGIGMTDTPEWNTSYIPVQICMCVVGTAWLILFGLANGWFDEWEEDDLWDM